MGGVCGAPMTPEEREAAKTDKDIQNKHRVDVEEEHNKIKLLLLGAGESGKSAIFKQMRVLYGKPLTSDELTNARQVIHSNVVEFMRTLCEGATTLGLEDSIKAKEEWFKVLHVDTKFALTSPLEDSALTVGEAIKKLWADEGIRVVWEQRAKLQVVESHSKFLDEIDRIRAHDFQPTVQDSVLARVRTTGIVAEHLLIEDNTFSLFDVGGQRNERRKWIHVFDNVTCVIFVAALSEYDQTLFEDNTKNRMVEAIELFEWISNHKLFLRKPIILFLNKMDLMRDKLDKFPVHQVDLWGDCPQVQGDVDAKFDAAWKYFYDKFHAAGTKGNPAKDIYGRITCATDPANVQHVFLSCKDVILKANLADSGLI